MFESPLLARSLAEAYLYLLAVPCPECGQGPLHAGDAVVTRTDGPAGFLTLAARCGACQAGCRFAFQVPRERLKVEPNARIAEGAEPSRIIDVGQWITLFRVISEAAGRSSDPSQIRRFGIDAGHCLEEALKFYEPDDELPSPTAVFTESTRRRFSEHPEQFSRRRLLDLRAKLPKPSKFAGQ